MRRTLLAVVLTALSGPAAADEEDAAAVARAAADDLAAASERLASVEGTTDRIVALTEIVRAYETGLSAMRDSLRNVTLEERALTEAVREKTAELSGLLAILLAAERTPEMRPMLHPDGPAAGVRAAILAADLAPALESRRGALADDLRTLTELRKVQAAGLSTLEGALADVRTARTSLAEAARARIALPPNVATDSAAIEALINSTETLAAFADSLVPEAPSARNYLGRYRLPVVGEIVSRFTERNPGWTFATPPGALVTAPADASVRFAGTMPDRGTVLVIEPSPGRLILMTGLGETLVSRSQIVAMGDPIALMPGEPPPIQENLIESVARDGQSPGERLYMEIRQSQAPVDPTIFFRTGEQ